MIQIEIESTGKILPLPKKERLRVTFQAADFGDAGSGSGSFSTTFTLPMSSEVLALLGFSNVLNVQSQFSPYKNIKARLLENNNEIDRGFIRIDEDDTVKKEIKLTFFGRNVDWFTAMGDKTLRDLDLSIYDHYKTNQAINEIRDSGYVYLPVDYGTLQNKSTATITADEIWPAVFVNVLVKQMFKELGFKVGGTVLEKPEFNRLIIPFSLEEVNMTFAKRANLSTVVTKNNSSEDYNVNLPAYNPSLEIKLQLDATSPYVYTYDNDKPIYEYGIGSGFESYDLRDDTEAYDITTSVYTAQAKIDSDVFVSTEGIFLILGGSGGTKDIFDIDIILKKNGTEIGRKSVQQYGSGYRVGNFNYAIFQNVSLEINDTLEVYFQVKDTYDSGYYGYSSLYAPKPYLIVLPKLTALEGILFPLGTFLPNMAQSKLMEYLFFAFGIIPSYDKTTNTVLLDSIQDLNVSNAEDWGDKIDNSQPIERKYFDFVSDYAKKNLCTYTEQDDDAETKAYQDTYLTSYGSGSIEIENDFLDSESDWYEAPFFPTKQRKVFTGVSNLDFQLPYIFKEDSDEGRILLFAGNRSVSELSNSVISTVSIAGTSRSTIPYSYFIPPVNININDPINLNNLGMGNPLDDNAISVPILQRVYFNLQRILNKPVSITANLKLSAFDIANVKYNRLKYFEQLGGYYYLNKIGQYDGSGNPTECELIKWY